MRESSAFQRRNWRTFREPGSGWGAPSEPFGGSSQSRHDTAAPLPHSLGLLDFRLEDFDAFGSSFTLIAGTLESTAAVVSPLPASTAFSVEALALLLILYDCG
jgi:hypothetical protein